MSFRDVAHGESCESYRLMLHEITQGRNDMPFTRGHSFLVHPSRAEAKTATAQPNIGGVEVTPQAGQLFGMLSGVFDKAHDECTIEIAFQPDSNGQQVNDVCTLLKTYLKYPNIRTARNIAERLQSVTTHRSGLGLLFLLAGPDGNGSRLVVARFPADEGIVATEKSKSLTLEFLERVFMKSAFSYKAALYRAASPTAGFWDGAAVDRQLNEGAISQYWIGEFLGSQFRTGGPAGTRRLALALKKAIRTSTDTSVREELWSAAKLMRNQAAVNTSAARILQNLGLSAPAVDEITQSMPRRELLNETFKFNRDEFDSHIAYRSVELDNGGVMTAENENFEKVFRSERIPGTTSDEFRFTTQGKIVGRLTRMKP